MLVQALRFINRSQLNWDKCKRLACLIAVLTNALACTVSDPGNVGTGDMSSPAEGKDPQGFPIEDALAQSEPALIIDADIAAIEELRGLIAGELGQTSVQVASTLFQKRSLASFGKKDYSGRSRELPIRFELRIIEKTCVLVAFDSNRAWKLEKVRCKAEYEK